ncbi:MAG: hypothetical protein ABR955_10735 [Verrucomicrobiota bacterium]
MVLRFEIRPASLEPTPETPKATILFQYIVAPNDFRRIIRSNFHLGRAKVIFMLLITSNRSKELLYVTFSGRVRVEEFQNAREDLTTELGVMPPGFHYLVDFSQLESMGLECVPELGRIMDLLRAAGVGLVVRVIPDPAKDIGMNILTIFHYPKHLKVITCQNLTEAARALAL